MHTNLRPTICVATSVAFWVVCQSTHAALVIDTDGERIQAVYRILNPDKLAGLAPAG